jgi:hypothetical protein
MEPWMALFLGTLHIDASFIKLNHCGKCLSYFSSKDTGVGSGNISILILYGQGSTDVGCSLLTCTEIVKMKQSDGSFTTGKINFTLILYLHQKHQCHMYEGPHTHTSYRFTV